MKTNKKMYNILNGEATRMMLFTLLIEESDRYIQGTDTFDNEYIELHEIERDMHLLNRFPTNSTYLKITADDSFIPLGNKVLYQNMLSQSPNHVYILSSYNWPMNYIHCADGGLPNRVHINPKELYGENILINEFADYIKEYYQEKTGKKQFGRDKLLTICNALNMIYLDICGWLLAAETADIDEFSQNEMYTQLKHDIDTKNPNCPIQNIIPTITLTRLIILGNSNSQPGPITELTELFHYGIKILCEKFDYNLTNISHILKVGFERFLVYTSEIIDEDSDFPPLLKRLNNKDIKKYTQLVGIRVINKKDLPAYKKYIDDTKEGNYTIN